MKLNKQQKINSPKNCKPFAGKAYLYSITPIIFCFFFLASCASHRSGRYIFVNGKWVFHTSRVGFNSGSKKMNHNRKGYTNPSQEDFIWPVPASKRVSSHYGKRGRRHHDGVDIAAKTGTHIIASAKGVVSFVGSMRGYGKTVVIKHSNSHHTVYAHNSKNHVRKGQKVSQGEVIANVGSTGRSTGPHLHFEIRRNNKSRNPAGYLTRLKK